VDIDIAVIGSLNRDLTVRTSRHPQPGETVLGTRHYWDGGGKGANQAVAAARLGSRVGMIGRVGHDDHGAALINDLASEGIDTTGIGVSEETLTGLAVITVDDDTENTIVVSPGANMSLGTDHIAAHQVLLAEAKVTLAQLEVPLETVVAAAEAAGGLVCLNPAPARPLPDELLHRVDVLVPNRSELAFLTGIPLSQTIGEVERAVSRLRFSGAVVVTLGADGALVIDGDTVAHVEAPHVEAVDPTGAGDAFCGALAHSLSQGQTLLEAASWAVVAGAVSATRHGAQTSMPTPTDMEALLPA